MNIPFFGKKKTDEHKSAKALISSAYNVYNYRCDVMGKENAEKLHALIQKTEELFNNGKTHSDEYKKTSEEMEKLMRRHGGMIYPLGFWADNVDVVIVAGILALTVRSFFVQTFQIPTNSMYPTYYGMTPHVYNVGEESPTGISKLGRKIFKGASNYKVAAPDSGEVLLEVFRHERGIALKSEVRPARWLGVLPTTERVYTFLSGQQKIELAVPADFNLDFDMFKTLNPALVQKYGSYYVSLGHFKKGENILNFDILAGDMLLVDRFTYNFRKPRVGEPFVFKTGDIEGMTARNGGTSVDLYYIKRLVGQGGDTLKIEGSTLMRNGKPISGSPAFEANAGKLANYPGYRMEEALAEGKTVTVPQRQYYAMGDNSANSQDSRYWGGVPEKAVVGKPLVIFYPFTQRWGAAK